MSTTDSNIDTEGAANGAEGEAVYAFPCSYAQRRLWFIDQLQPGTALYNQPLSLLLKGRLDLHALRSALTEVVRRHETLRTTFARSGEEPEQLIHPPSPVPLSVVDLSDLPADVRETEARRLAAEEARRPFDLSTGPLLRASLLRLSEAEHVLLFTTHHVISDGWSLEVLVKEVAALYDAYSKGRPSPLAELPVQYADYTIWQRTHLRGALLDAELAYWKQQLAGAPPLLELPTDFPRPPVQRHTGAHLPFALGAELSAGLRRLAVARGVTPFMLVLAAFQLLLSKYSGQEDVVVGTPVANRTRAETEGLIGFFVNTLAVRSDLAGDPSFVELLARVREACVAAYAHQEVPFERVVEAVEPERNLSHDPVFQVMFAWQTAPASRLSLRDLEVAPFRKEVGIAKFDLLLAMQDSEGNISGTLEYSDELFEATTAERMVGHFKNLLESIVAAPHRPISELPLLGADEARQLTERWSRSSDSDRSDDRLQQLFEQQAARTPDAVAVVFGQERLTYGELNARANRLAHHLRALGVGPDVIVGLMLNRSTEMLVALLGILKAGGAYLPLDPAYPVERLRLMLDDARARILLTQSELVARLPEQRVRPVLLDSEDERQLIERHAEDNPASINHADNLAYVMYTSGSTGGPKGVAMTHRPLVSLLRWQLGDASRPRAPRTLQFTSLSFDVSFQEIFLSWSAGATLVLTDEETRRDAARLWRTLVGERVERLFLPFVALQNLAEAAEPDEAAPASLREVITAGEQLKITRPLASLLQRLEGCVLENQYGPMESHVVTSHRLSGSPGEWELLPPIGRPVTNSRVYVLDARLRPVPTGVIGELHIGGDVLARGYLNRPALTAEKFIPDPFSTTPGARLYRTGDRARFRADGVLEFLGRADDQVKVRGFRVELGEVEAALSSHPSVRECAVLLYDDGTGNRRLTAYATPQKGASPTAGELRAHLRERLPEHMVPTGFVLLDEMPLTPSGKVNRKALPAPDESALADERTRTSPRSPIEEALTGMWKEILGVERVGLEDNFFELGGHSLLATQLVSRVRKTFRVEVPVRQIFAEPTVSRLRAFVEAQLRAGSYTDLPPLVNVSRDEPISLSYAQRRLWFVDQLRPRDPFYNMPFALRLRGALDAHALADALSEVVRRHETLRTTFAQSGGEPEQVIHTPAPVPLPLTDLSDLPADVREIEARRLAQEEASRPFDLAAGPLLRASLLRLLEEEHVLLMTMHHIVTDGWSLSVLVNEVAALYDAFARGDSSPLEELPVQYADYAVWQRGWLAGRKLDVELAYWTQRLAGAPPLLELPTDFPRPPVQRHTGAHLPFALGTELSAALRRLAVARGVTPFMLVLAAFQLLLSRYSGQDDIVVGTPVANRTRAEVEPLIGFFVNTLAVRADLAGDPTFVELLSRVREACVGAYAHQEAPFEKVVEAVEPQRSLSHAPIFQVMAAWQSAGAPHLSLRGLELSPVETQVVTTKFDLLLTLQDSGGNIGGGFGYDLELFEAASVERMVGHFRALLEEVIADDARPISALPMLREDERAELAVGRNLTRREYPRDKCIHELIEEQAARTPDAVALFFEGETVTYADLERRANRLAHYLRGKGVRPGVRVGLYLAHSIEAVVALLAVLKAGGAYVPFDPEHPTARLAFMLEDARIRLTLTQEALKERLPATEGVELICLDALRVPLSNESAEAPPRSAEPDDVAYVIYTSGSTGLPKGVEIQHRALVNYVCWSKDVYVGGAESSFALYSSLSFDLTVTSVFTPLITGNRVVIYRPDEYESPVAAIIAGGEVDVLKLTPSHLSLIKGADNSGSRVRRLVVGGEALETALAREVFESFGGGVEIYNEYGPTEATVGCMLYRFDPARDTRRQVPIGRPAANVQIYVLDGRLNLCAENVVGELYIAGAGLARGYLNREELTAERFVANPFEPGERMYRSGDLARWLPSGEVGFLGRRDEQVKFHGYRVELNEIRGALNTHPKVRDSVVLVHRDEHGHSVMVAYYASRQELEVAQLREHMLTQVIKETVPNLFVHLKRLPLTMNGKVNHAALPTLEEARGSAAGRNVFVAPRTKVEETLAGIWKELLGVEQVGVRDNFFELGGHSLLATQVVTRVRHALGVEISVRVLFEKPTLEGLAASVEPLAREGEERVAALLERLEHLSDEEVAALLGTDPAEEHG
ncbi:MAG TPA: amino acid adenylation domain-containing protein [Pyrinomonadaceae bacterium]